MIHAPHPALRRLFALGSAPGRALSALDAGRAALDGLSRELDALPLLSDAVVAALAASLDLSALHAAVEGGPLPPRRPEPAGLPGGGAGGLGEGPGPVPERPRPRAAVAEPERRAGGTRTADGVPAHTAAAARVEALLARHAPETGGQPLQGPPGGPPRHRTAGDASGEGREGAAVPLHEADRHQPRRRPRRVSEPRLRASARSADEAAGLLPRRAARAGSEEAAGTPVGATPAPADVERLLAGGEMRVRAAETPSPAPAGTARGGGRGVESPAGPLGRLAVAVARVERRAPRARRASGPQALPEYPGPAARWGGGPSPTTGQETAPVPRRGAGPGPAEEPEVPRENLGGLGGLLRRVASLHAEDGASGRRPAPPGEAGPNLRAERMPREAGPNLLAERMPREAGPNLLAERMEDTLLSDRLAAVLRREAMCQGVDLERVD